MPDDPVTGEIRVGLVAEPLHHRVPGGTGVATLALLEGLRSHPSVTVEPIVARHRRGQISCELGDARQWLLPRALLYESWARFGGRPGAGRVASAVDIVHSPMLPAPRRGNVPLVVTLHDLAFLDYPDAFPARARRLYVRMWNRVREEADVVLCSSEATRTAALASGLESSRSLVVPLGTHASAVSASVVEAVLARHGLSSPYVLSVGTAEPRKNLGRLIDAYARSGLAVSGTELVIVGPLGWRETVDAHLDGLAESHRSKVRQLGTVSHGDLQALYRGAQLFCYPSLLEGFGLPVLEAMAHRTAVITSGTTATGEVAGDAALLVDPLDVDDLAGALANLSRDEKLRDDLGRRGLERATQFTWSRHVELTVAAYRSLVR